MDTSIFMISMNADYRKLKVWHMGMDLCNQTYNVIEKDKFPKDDTNMINQIKRAVVSVPANIAEGASSRFEKNFLSYLNISFCSLKELETLIKICSERKFIDDNDFLAISMQADKLGAKLYFLMDEVDKRVKDRNLMKYGMGRSRA
jgi:four helix bundle protein